MPMVKNLENVHQELMEIARESNRLSYTRYTSEDVEKLQNKLRDIDSQYTEGCFNQTSYEEEGLAQVSDELEKVHKTLHRMLTRID
jgi:lipid II:glycine glycyltransferase (peptidoglycan interpeptide bridge formation enzyme)